MIEWAGKRIATMGRVGAGRRLGAVSIMLGCVFATGCGRAPSVDVIGSFFPVWMLCLAVAVVLTFVVRYILLRYKLETEVGPLTLFYPCTVIFLTSLLWLIFFR